MINEVPTCADQPAPRPRPDQNADVIKHDASGGLANKTRKLRERRPCGRGVKPFAIPTCRCHGRAAAPLRVGRTEVGDIPLDRTQWVLMIHMYVVETFHLATLCVLNHCVVRASQITEASLSSRLGALGAHFEDLLLRWQPRQHVAGHVDELS